MLFRKQPTGTTPELTKASRLDRLGLTSRLRRLIAAGVAIAVAGLTVLSLGLAGVASASTTSSGLGWRSGAWLQNDNPSTAAAFGAWRGHPLDVVDDWSNRATWQDITDPTWLYQKWAGSPYTMSFGVAMLPSNVPGVSLAACAAARTTPTGSSLAA